MRNFLKTPDGSIIGRDGKIIYFSCERFVRDICCGDHCFICGASRESTTFNDEHILPNWVLRRFKLHSKSITLPNGDDFQYGGYKIACCYSCNTLMGREVEEPVRALLASGSDAVNAHLMEQGPLLFFVWMGLIFLKCHLRDKKFRMNKDIRANDGHIADLYDWQDLHHLHTIARCFYTGAQVAPSAMGSFLVVPARIEDPSEVFDYSDLYPQQCMLLRVNDLAFYAVFNDACGALNGLEKKIAGIEGALNFLQLREILAELGFVNYHIKNRPIFLSRLTGSPKYYEIYGEIPEKFELSDLNFAKRGEFLEHVFRNLPLDRLILRNNSEADLRSLLQQGRITFLFDDAGRFIGDDNQQGLLTENTISEQFTEGSASREPPKQVDINP